AADPAAPPRDPVQTYLRQIASVPLLSREREVELAKRIEEGRRLVLAALLGSPASITDLVGPGRQVERKELRVRDLVDGLDDDAADPDDDGHARRVLRQ